jgi:hypothetical protein
MVECKKHSNWNKWKETIEFEPNSIKKINCRSGFATLPPEPLQEQPAVVLLWGRPLASWLLALGERGGLGDLHRSSRLKHNTLRPREN